MKNSYRGYWFSCETLFNSNAFTQPLLEPRTWVLLLESKLNNKIISIDLDSKSTLGQVLDIAYLEIDKQILLDSKQA